MATFPGAVASFAGFTATHTLAQDTHASQHNSEQAEIIAAQTKVGTGASTPSSGMVLRGTGTGTSAWGQAVLTTDISGILPQANGGTGQNSLTSLPLVSPVITSGGSWAGSPTITSPTIVTPTIASFANATHNHSNAAGGGQLGASALSANAISKATTIFNEVAGSPGQNVSTAAWTDVTNWTGGSLTTSGGDVILYMELSSFHSTAGNVNVFRITVDSTNYPSDSGMRTYFNELLSHRPFSRTVYVSGLGSGVHTVKIQTICGDSGNVSFDNQDYLRLTAVELIR